MTIIRMLLLRRRERRRSIVMRTSVCVSVCMSVHERISGITLAIFTNFSVHAAYGRGSVLLWQGDEIQTERANFWRLSGSFKSIGNLRCTRRCRVRRKRIANNGMQQKGSFSKRSKHKVIRKILNAGNAAYWPGRSDGSAQSGRSLISTIVMRLGQFWYLNSDWSRAELS